MKKSEWRVKDNFHDIVVTLYFDDSVKSKKCENAIEKMMNNEEELENSTTINSSALLMLLDDVPMIEIGNSNGYKFMSYTFLEIKDEYIQQIKDFIDNLKK